MMRSSKAKLGPAAAPGFRSRLMARVRQRDTTPEMAVRRAVTSLGVRYRLQRRDLPGSPDLAFASRRTVVFVHGCFWHSHAGCRHATTPKTRTEYWSEKLASNRRRDARVEGELRNAGWQVAVVWECETRDSPLLLRLLSTLLGVSVDVGTEPADHRESFEDRRRHV